MKNEGRKNGRSSPRRTNKNKPQQPQCSSSSSEAFFTDDGGINSNSNSHSNSNSKDRSLVTKICEAMYRIITIMSVSIVMIVLCVLLFSFIMENNNNNNTSNQFDASSSFVKTKWERTKIRAYSMYVASTAPLPSQSASPAVTLEDTDLKDSSSSIKLESESESNSESKLLKEKKKKTRNTKKKKQIDKVKLGKKLLKNGDPIAAETLCKAALEDNRNKSENKDKKKVVDGSNNDDDNHDDDIDADNINLNEEYVQALVCLGESRLALHNTAYNFNSDVFDLDLELELNLDEHEHEHEHKRGLVYDRLHAAKHDFDKAVSMQPTNLNARLGLGLSYFLIATRELRPYEQQQQQSSPSSSYTQLLFNSILHFESISVLVSSYQQQHNDDDDDDNNNEDDYNDMTSEEMENIRLSALYNNGLAHLALGDFKSATPILTKVSNHIEGYYANDENKHDQDPTKSRILSSAKTNLGAALLQVGSSNQAIMTMNHPKIVQYCKDESIDTDTSTSASTSTSTNSKMGDLSLEQQRYIHKQCSILLNNLSIAQEKVRNSGGSGNSSITAGNADVAQVSDGDSSSTTEVDESLSDVSLIYESKLGLESIGFATMNALEKMGKKIQQLPVPVQVPMKDSDDISSNVSDGDGDQNKSSDKNHEEETNHDDTMIKEQQQQQQTLEDDKNEDEVKSDNTDDSKEPNTDSIPSVTTVVVEDVSPSEKDSTLEGSAMIIGATQWLSLSRAKLDVGDVEGAVEATTKALNVAKGFDEIEACTRALEEALGEMSKMTLTLTRSTSKAATPTKNEKLRDINTSTSIPLTATKSSSSSIDDDVHILRLEQEVLSLKMQLLQQSVMTSVPSLGGNGAFFRHPLGVDVQGVTNESDVDKDQSQVQDNETTDESINIQKEKVSQADKEATQEEIETNIEQTSNITEIPISQNEEEMETVDQQNIEEELESTPATPESENDVDSGTSNETIIESQTVVDDIGDVVDENAEADDVEIIEQDNDHEKEHDDVSTSLEADEGDSMVEDNEDVAIDIDETVDKVAVAELESEEIPAPTNSTEEVDLIQENILDEDQIKDVENSVVSSDDSEHPSDDSLVEEMADNSNDEEEKEQIESPEEEEIEEEEEVILPELYNPEKKEAGEAAPSSVAYMKVADAYIQKQNYKLASKQFLKVLKKTPGYIPAILGYATSMERYVKPKQLGDVAIAYANVTVYALEQDNVGLAGATFKRSLKVSESIEGDRIETLKFLSTISFTKDLATEIYYELGLELMKSESTISDALEAFKISNAFGSETQNIFSSKSLFQIAKLTLDMEGKSKKVLQKIETALSQGMGDLQADGLVLSGQIKETLLNTSGAIEDYQKAIEYPKSESTGVAHYNLAMALKSVEGNVRTIENHIEMALNLGVDVTPEAVEILGEDHIAIMNSVHRAEWEQYQESTNDQSTGRGGIMSGSGLSSESIFTKQDAGTEGGGGEENVDALSMLEQGAASYDGSVPVGDGALDDETTSTLSNQQRSSSTKVNEERKLNF